MDSQVGHSHMFLEITVLTSQRPSRRLHLVLFPLQYFPKSGSSYSYEVFYKTFKQKPLIAQCFHYQLMPNILNRSLFPATELFVQIEKANHTTVKSNVVQNHLPKIKVRLSTSQKNFFIYVNESPLRTMKNAFYFMLKAFFVLDNKQVKYTYCLISQKVKTAR